MASTLAFKNEGDAKAWVATANQLNKRAKELNDMVGHILESIKNESEGDIVLKLVDTATAMLNFATAVMEVMENIANTISDTINAVVDTVGNVLNAIGSIFG